MALDYYQVLGINKEAGQTEVKRAYRQKARSLHPDVNKRPSAVEEFQALQQAYAVLSDADKRAQYDEGEEVVVIVNEQPTPAPNYQRRAWNNSSKYDPGNHYIDTDYEHFARLNTIIGIITLLFASTFLVDFLFSDEQKGLTILAIENKGLSTGKSDDLRYLIIETDGGEFTKDKEKPELQVGELIDLKSSLIYNFRQYKRSNETNFKRVTAAPMITYVIAVLVYIASLNAVLNKKRPERKFNAAIIAAFFSVMLLVFALA